MCLPPKVALEKAEHKKFNVQKFWDRHFGEDGDDESSDEESSDGERSDSGRPSHEPGTDRDDETARSDDEASDDEGSDGESSDDERSDSGRPSHESGTNPNDDAASEDSWGSDEAPPLELNYDALKHIAEHFLPGSHGACTDIATGERSGYNEVRILHFEDGWSCVGHFARDPKDKILEQFESSLATMEYVRTHTTIPVPQVYFVNHDENHVVGSAFVLMERMPGNEETLLEGWYELSREQKIGLVGELADIIGQLSKLHFDSMGCLKHDGTVGPLLSIRNEARKLGDQPVTTMEEYICAYMNENDPNRSEEVKEYYPAIKEELMAVLERMGDTPTLRAPYRLIHGAFEGYNILVERKDDAVRISGLNDWDFSRIGPLYQLYEYPLFIRDHDGESEDFEINKVLRKHFVASLAKQFPRGSADREHVKQCFREKNYALNTLHNVFMFRTVGPPYDEELVRSYLKGLRGESNGYFTRAYGSVWDWQPDSEPESDLD